MSDNPYQPPISDRDAPIGTSILRMWNCLYWFGISSIVVSVLTYTIVNWLFTRQKSTQYIYGPYVSVVDAIVPPVLVVSFAAIIVARHFRNQEQA